MNNSKNKNYLARERLNSLLSALALFAVYAIAINLNLFVRFWWLVVSMHFTGGAIIALIYIAYTRPAKSLKKDAGRLIFILASAGAAASVGILWEVYELAIDTFLIPNFMGDRNDTIADIVVDILGGAMVGYLKYSNSRNKSNDLH